MEPSDSFDAVRDITDEVERISRDYYPFSSGDYGDIWKGKWVTQGQRNEVAVAIKVLRVSHTEPILHAKFKKRLRKELRVWQQLDHPNVLPLCGVSFRFGYHASFVCPWMEGGCLADFLELNNATLQLPRRLNILCDTLEGLKYLHENTIVHGNLTSTNVLLHADGHAILSDFGLSSIVDDIKSTTFITSTVSGNMRWTAPELVQLPEDDAELLIQPTYQSDMYSFGCLTLETLSGKAPYYYLVRDAQVLLYISRGIKPRRPSTDVVNDKLWEFIQRCWVPTGQRLSAERALGYIHEILT